MIDKIKYIIVCIFLFHILFPQCEDYTIGDINDDNILNVLDIIAIVNIIIDEQEYNYMYDLNFDYIINISDIIILINRITDEHPLNIDIIDINFDFNELLISWNSTQDYGFESYNVYYSNIISEELSLIYTTNLVLDTSIVITNIELKEQNWFNISVIDFLGCELISNQYYYELPYQNYELDENGNIISTNIQVEDFDSSSDCYSCHETHYNEWNESMHAYSMHSPLFFAYKNQTIEDHPDVGGQFCIQCHNPAAFLTNNDINIYETVDELQSSQLPEIIKDGIGCDICHTTTGLSQTIFTGNDGAANAIYKLFPGQNIKFGPIENPTNNNFHESYYLPTYSSSQMCLPCHDLVVRDVEAEITFTEWDRIPGFSMFGGIPCQQCHMPLKEDGTHDHTFIGVDLDLNVPYQTNPIYNKTSDLLQTSVNMEFGIWGVELAENINPLDTLFIPITIESLTAHSIPSGTSFNREAWIEIKVENNNQIIYSSGLIDNNQDQLNYEDEELLLFKSFLLNEQGDTTNSVIDAFEIINNNLAAYSQRFVQYPVLIPEDISGELYINVRMLFRAFDPSFILEHHAEFIDNLPVFEMNTISDTVIIN